MLSCFKKHDKLMKNNKIIENISNPFHLFLLKSAYFILCAKDYFKISGKIKMIKKAKNKRATILQSGHNFGEAVSKKIEGGSYVDLKKPSDFKRCFNKFFHEDLYGKYKSDENIILSTGSLNQDEFSLPYSLKFAVSYALMRNWYGYSCSLGRESARSAIADLENYKMSNKVCNENNVALTQGVTAGLFHLLSFLKDNKESEDFSILTHYPTYIPFATTCEKIAPTKIINFFGDRKFNLEIIKQNIDQTTKVILLLGDFNPLGRLMDISFVNDLIDFCNDKEIYLIIDEAGSKYPENKWHGLRQSQFLIRMESLSKKVSVPGMKLGYFIADENIISKFYERASTSYGGPSSFFYLLQELDARFDLFSRKGLSRLGAEEVLLFDKNYHLGSFFLNVLYKQYARNKELFELKIDQHRDIVINQLASYFPRLVKNIIIPETGINVFLQLNINYNSYELFKKLIIEKKTAVFPGLCSAVEEDCWIRITCGVDKKTLQVGLDNLVSFLKVEWVKDQIKNKPVFETLLMNLGQYEKYKYLSFFEHIYDVLEKGTKIINIFEKKFKRKLDHNLLREAIFCHDAGKVVSVMVSRIMRILQLQKKYKKIPESVLSRLRGEDLLGLREKITNGFRLTKDDFYEKFPFLHCYNELINWDSGEPPKDVVFTGEMFHLLLKKYPEKQKRIKKIKSIVIANCSDINEKNLDLVNNPYIFILDLSDKLADYKFPENPNLERISDLLNKKKRYVIKRYCKGNKSLKLSVCSEFNKVYKLIENLNMS